MRAERIWLGEASAPTLKSPVSCTCQASRPHPHSYKPSTSRLAASSTRQQPLSRLESSCNRSNRARSVRSLAKRRADDSDSDSEEGAPKLKNISRQLNLPASAGKSVSVDSSADEGVEEGAEEDEEDDIEDLEDEGGDDEDDVDSAQDAIRY